MTNQSIFGPFADWTDASQYPDSDSTRIEQWVWEFVRRNPQYQVDWETEYAGYPKRQPSRPGLFTAGVDPEEAIYTTYAEHGRSYYLDEYGLSYVINPAVAEPSERFLHFNFKPGRVHLPGHYTDSENEEPDDIAFVTIDLNYPLARQFMIARVSLAQLQHTREIMFQKKTRGKHNSPSNWPGYLRVLDAVKKDVSNEHIAACIYPDHSNTYPDYNGNQTVRDDLAAAERLRDRDFRHMILQQPQAKLKKWLAEELNRRKERHTAGMKSIEKRHGKA